MFISLLQVTVVQCTLYCTHARAHTHTHTHTHTHVLTQSVGIHQFVGYYTQNGRATSLSSFPRNTHHHVRVSCYILVTSQGDITICVHASTVCKASISAAKDREYSYAPFTGFHVNVPTYKRIFKSIIHVQCDRFPVQSPPKSSSPNQQGQPHSLIQTPTQPSQRGSHPCICTTPFSA